MIQVKDGDQRFPFSQGIMAKSLTGAGLPVEDAYKVVRRVYDILQQDGVQEIKANKLREMVSCQLLEKGWKTEERFYRVRRRIKYLDEPLFILVGGATGVGKSSISAELGHRLGINRVIGSDTIREIMRSIIPRNLIPTLHQSSFTAEGALQSPHVKEKRIYAFEQQVQVVTQGVAAVIRRGVKEGLHMVLNGVHLVPGFLEKALDDMPGYAFSYVLSVPDREQHAMFFYEREKGTRREAKRYIQSMESIQDLQEYIVECARGRNVPVLENNEYETTLRTMLEDIISGLSEEVEK